MGSTTNLTKENRRKPSKSPYTEGSWGQVGSYSRITCPFTLLRVSVNKAANCCFELILYPSYSPELDLFVFFLFPKLKSHLLGRYFGTNDKIIYAVEELSEDDDATFVRNISFLQCLIIVESSALTPRENILKNRENWLISPTPPGRGLEIVERTTWKIYESPSMGKELDRLGCIYLLDNYSERRKYLNSNYSWNGWAPSICLTYETPRQWTWCGIFDREIMYWFLNFYFI